MTIYIAHLSDVHLKAPTDIAKLHTDELAQAIAAHMGATGKLVLIITGDIAYSGRSEQYVVATTFLQQLRSKIESFGCSGAFEVIVVPGNHDCNFDLDNPARQRLIASLATEVPAASDRDTARVCAAVQGDFRQFAVDVTGRSHADDQPCEQVQLTYGDRKIVFHCCNSALTSKLREKQGDLTFPHADIEEPRDGAISIALMHHPLGWFESTNARQLRSKLDEAAQIILTGHEHMSLAYERTTLTTRHSALWIEGAVLLEENSEQSGFNLIELDLSADRLRVYLYAWDGEIYSPQSQSDWTDFSAQNRRGKWSVTAEFDRDLEDPGAPFTHPHVAKLTLEDLFISPDLRLREAEEGQSPRKIASAETLAFVMSAPRFLLVGAEDSGKTTFLKRLFTQLRAEGRVPLLIRGDELKRPDAQHVDRVIENAINYQYGCDLGLAFKQVERNRRVVLLDDLHRTKLNTKGMGKLLDRLGEQFGTLVCSVDDLFEMNLTASSAGAEILQAFVVGELREFGYQLRGALIERWVRLGREESLSDVEADHEVMRVERQLDALIGKSLFPAYPLFILTVLQTIEAMSGLQTAQVGTYGYVYESLITKRLSGSRDISLDTKYNFLAFIANALFAQGQRTMSRLEMEGLTRRYFDQYRVQLAADKLLAEFVSAGLMIRSGDDYSFRYKYIYYYFVGRYFAYGLEDPDLEQDLRARIEALIANIHVEESANVILFLLYQTKDRGVIDTLFKKAEELHGSVQPVNFDGDVQFVEQLGRPKGLNAPAGDVADNRLSTRRKRDDRARVDSETAELDRLFGLNSSMKTVQIFGQLLRNFSGSLPGKLKTNIALACCRLTLRSLRVIFDALEGNIVEIRAEVRRALSERKAMDGERLDRRTDEVMFRLVTLFAHAMIKRLSFAIGSEDLAQTYRDALQEWSPVSMRVVEAAIKLDHFREIASSELDELYKAIADRALPAAVLRQLVWDRLYLFSVDYDERQRLCSVVEIKSQPVLIGTSSKRTRK